MEINNDSDPEQSWFVGIDVGGTSIKVGIASEHGQLVAETSIPTQNELGPQDAIKRIGEELAPVFASEGRRIQGVGIGTPGPLNAAAGIVLDPVNLPGWRHFPIRDEVSRALNRPVEYTNDANAAAFGEYWTGKGKPYENLVLLTLGTGVGAGIICHNTLIAGAHDHAAECGHMSVDFCRDARICSCGRPGHLEAYASASAVAAIATEVARNCPASSLGEVLKNNGSLAAKDVYDCASQHDQMALEIVDQTAGYLARGIADIAHTVDPDIVLLGGAMDFGGENSEIGRRFLDRIDREVRDKVFQEIADNVKIEFASLGGSAGWIGAAGMAKRVYDQTL